MARWEMAGLGAAASRMPGPPHAQSWMHAFCTVVPSSPLPINAEPPVAHQLSLLFET